MKWASDYLRSRNSDEPWFLAVGLMKPHLDWHVPKRYYELYDRSAIVPPEDGWSDDDLPLYFQQFLTPVVHRRVLNADSWEEAIQAYMAAVSFADAQLGTLLDAMDRAGAWKNTTVVLWSDHGYHLGDQQAWGKFTHWEHGTNAPLIIVDPDVGRPGTVVQTPVSLLDVFPTLVDLTGVRDGLAHRDGHSLVPLMRDPDARWGHFAGTIMDGSVSLRSERYRYIASIDGSEQLYDMRADPGQTTNLADDPDFWSALGRLRREAAAEVERLGGQLDLRHERLRGTGGDDGMLVSPNLEAAIGGDGDDRYLAIDPDAIVEKRDGGFDSLRLFAPREGKAVQAKVPFSVELTELDRSAAGSIRGSRGDDIILGSQGADRLSGGHGDDTLAASAGGDLLRGGTGDDRLDGKAGFDRLDGGFGADGLRGGGGGDRVDGGAGADKLSGDDFHDALHGGKGDDSLVGGAGRDLIAGGKGDDRLRGDAGADRFAFAARAGTDVIRDFRPGTDRVDLGKLGLDGFGEIDRDTTAGGQALAVVPGADTRIVFRGLEWSDLDREDFLF